MREIKTYKLNTLIATISKVYNYDFSGYSISSLKRRIIKVMETQNLVEVDDLIKKVKEEEVFFSYFLSEITVNVTEMFRDPTFWLYLKSKIIPSIKSVGANKIRIWHAGCSSGEEVYSMAILLHEAGLLDKSIIVASDIDNKILENAKHGAISAKLMKVNAANYNEFNHSGNLEKYFNIENDRAYFLPELKDKITFKLHNLVSDDVFSKFDLILCRNVMIYFNVGLQNKVLTTLFESLFLRGYLALGSKESLLWSSLSSKFKLRDKHEMIYKKIKE